MDKSILTVITALGAPLLVFIGGLITWFFKTRKEELRAIEERALEKRITTYNKILHPLIVMFSHKADKRIHEKALKEIVSVEYKTAAFNLMTFGSDEMVQAYNSMMQSFFKSEVDQDPKKVLGKFAIFLLSVRKDVFDKNTKLEKWDMLKFMITDIDKYVD